MDVAPLVRTTYTSSGFIGTQIGYYGTDGGASHLLETHHTYGFVSRPRNADDKGGCSVFVHDDGDVGHALLSYDGRDADKAPRLEQGSSAQYCSSGAFVHLDGSTGDLTIYVPAPEGGSGAHIITASQSTGALVVAHADGMAVTMSDGVLALRAKGGTQFITMSESEIRLVGNVVVTGTAPVLGVPTFVSVPLLDCLGKLDTVLSTKLAPSPPIFTTPPPGYITPPV